MHCVHCGGQRSYTQKGAEAQVLALELGQVLGQVHRRKQHREQLPLHSRPRDVGTVVLVLWVPVVAHLSSTQWSHSCQRQGRSLIQRSQLERPWRHNPRRADMEVILGRRSQPRPHSHQIWHLLST